jgi:uncharacterized protein YbjQ (UPF0145 family)
MDWTIILELQSIIPVALIILGYWTGSAVEKKHYRSIKSRERKLLNLPAVTGKNFLDEKTEIEKAELVTGSVVISIDYFKRFLAALRNLFGGEVTSYETLVDRARREAVLRMKEKAEDADIIINLRIETSSIGRKASNRIGSIEALAYGTAVTIRSR